MKSIIYKQHDLTRTLYIKGSNSQNKRKKKSYDTQRMKFYDGDQ